jgi:hypothetical protein
MSEVFAGVVEGGSNVLWKVGSEEGNELGFGSEKPNLVLTNIERQGLR